MKKITLLSLNILVATSIASADECLHPSNISISKDSNTGKFTVKLPDGSGYQFLGETYPISATGPISFFSTRIQS